MNHMKQKKKWIVILLALCMLLIVLPAVSVSASEDDEENVLSALGFDTSEEPDDYIAGDGASTPYGVDVTTVAPVSELYTIGSDIIDGALLYGNNLDLGATTDELIGSATTVGHHMPGTAYQATAGSFDGSGLDGQVATLVVTQNGTDGVYSYDLDLKLIDPNVLTSLVAYNQASKTLIDDSSEFANMGKSVGEDVEDYSEDPIMLQAYLEVAAGDFDGDSVDEIAVYIPEQDNPRVVVYQLQAGDGEDWQTPSAWKVQFTYALSYQNYVPNQVGLTACDMTGDGVDDLGITWGDLHNSTSYTASKAVVLCGSNAGHPLQTSVNVPITPYNGYGMLRASMAFGDADGDGKDNDLVISGQSIYDYYKAGEGNLTAWSRYIAAYRYDSDTKSFTPSVESNINMQDGDYGGELSVTGLRTALALVQKDGIGTQEYVYVDGILFRLDGGDFAPQQVVPASVLMGFCSVYDVVAADFNGDGQETIAVRLFDFYEDNEDLAYRLVYCEPDLTKVDGYEDWYTVLANYPCAFAAPNTDTDTMVLKYTGDHYLSYSDPEVLAVVASPPYFSDLEHLDGGDSYVGNSETVFASSSGSSTGAGISATVTGGGFVTFEQEFAIFGIKAAKFQMEAEVLTHLTAETEKSWERVQTIEYATMGGQDTVAMYSLPIDVYVYDAYIPVEQSDGSTVWEEQTMTINVPYNACIRTLTVEDYDAIAENYENLPIIRGNILNSIPGDPGTYPGSTGGYPGAAIYDGSYAGVGYGASGYIKQTLEMNEETTGSVSFSLEVSLKVGLGAGGFVAGPVVGSELGAGVTVTDMTGSAFSGTVFGMPEEAAQYGYSYSWKIFEYLYSDDEATFPVVSYVVNGLSAPAALPTDFHADVEKTTSHSVTLTWKASDPSTVGFQLYRHYDFPDGGGDYALGDVISADAYTSYDETTGEYTYYYTDENLEPYAQYQYCIQSISGTAPYYSVLSDTLSVYTTPEEGQPEITLSDSSLFLYPDETVDLSVTVTNDAENAKTPLYQWQKLVDNKWSSLTGETSPTLTFSEASLSDSGTYRCRVNQVVGTYYISAYSPRAEVVISKRTPAMEMTVTKDSSGDMTPEIAIELTNPGSSGTIPSGTVTFEILGNGYTQTVTKTVSSDGTVTLSDWTAPEQGLFNITASYNGNRIFKSVSTETSLLAGNAAGFWLEAPEKIVYGESMTPQVTRYTYDGEGNLEETQLSTTVDPTTGLVVSSVVFRSTSLSENEAAVKAHLLKEANNIQILYLLMLASVELMGDNYSVWVPMTGTYFDSPISGDTITPTAADNYRVDCRIVNTNNNNAVVKTLTQYFTVSPRPLTVTAPDATSAQADVEQPTAAGLSITSGSLGFTDTISSLGLGVKCVNTAGTTIVLNTSTSPGVYPIKVTTDTNHRTDQKNYKFTFIDGKYIVTGPTYPVSISAETLMDETVGSIDVFSPENFTNGTEYQYGTQMVFVADPDSGYEVASWTVNGVPLDPDTLENPNVLTKTIQNAAIDVVVAFKVQQATLTFGGTNGSVICVDSDMLESGDNVIANASYTFMAVPDEGYHLKEWRLYTSGLSYPTDSEDADGFHTCTITMGSVSANLVAVFERDSYVLSFGDHLIASYYWDDDDDNTTPDVQKTVSSGAEVMGDTEVTIQPAAGHRIADDGKWYVDGLAVTTVEDNPATTEDETVYYSGQDYVFQIIQDTEITADTEIQYYDVTVDTQWNGSGDEPDGNAVSVSVDGTPTGLDALTDLAGGSEVTFTAEPAYGAVLTHWLVNNETIDPDTLTNPEVYTCGAISEDLEVIAVFTDNEAYTVAISKEAHGDLSYRLNNGEDVSLGDEAGSFSIPVYEGDTLVFTAQPDQEFMVGGWTVDGTWYQTTSKTCTLNDISDDHTLALNFTAKAYYTVDFSAGANGSISAVMDDTYTLTSGEHPGGGTEICFTAEPDSGYMVAGWTVNGETVKTDLGTDYVDPVYTIKALSEDTTVSVTFETEQSWTVTLPSDEDHYTLTAVFDPDDYHFSGTSDLVRDGASAVITLTPETSYIIDSADIDGDTVSGFDDISVKSDGSWVCTLNAVTEDLTVTASAEAVYSITVATATGGTAEADADLCTAGTLVNITAEALDNYTFSGWTVTGVADGPVVIDDEEAAETYFIMPATNVTVTPSFTYSGSSGGGSPGGGGGSSSSTDEDEEITIRDAEGNSLKGTLTETETIVTVIIPRKDFDFLAKKSNSDVTIDMGSMTVIFDGKAIDSISDSSDPGDISLTVKEVDTSTLSVKAQAKISDRPVYDFTLMSGDTEISDFGGKATISIPYTLQRGEDSNAVVIYYIDNSGELHTVLGSYNEKTGTVDFTVTHFSVYAVGYNKVTFSDVIENVWYYDAVSFCAAREITTGTREKLFSPGMTLTRGQFIVMLMRAYEIQADETITDNFTDAGDTYYTGYLSAAKRLGITKGVGNNLYEPDAKITRQDMFTLLYRALEVMDELPEKNVSISLSSFSDADMISDYAKEAMEALVKAGIVSGSDGKLDPLGNSTRAQMVQVLYNLLSDKRN